MRPRILACLLLIIAIACSAALAVDLESLHSATARLTAADGGRGTGTAFERSQGYVWLVTCAHVATSPQLRVEWFYRGHQSGPVAGVVRWRDAGNDVAVIAVPESALGGVVPPVVPFAPPDHRATPGRPVYTVGSANGVWPTGFEGHALGYDQVGLQFLPPPQNGRSGSALVDESGRIVGVVRARSEKTGGTGIATPVQAMYRLWGTSVQKEVATAVTVPWYPATPVQERFRYQIPLPGVQRRQYFDGLQDGAQCGPGGCPPQQQQPQQQGGIFGGGGLWPTLPNAPQEQPGPPPALQYHPLDALPIDLTPISDSLGKLAGAVERLEKREAEKAEAQRQAAIVDALPLAPLGSAAGSAVKGDWSGAGASITGPEVGAWAAGGIAALLVGFFGLRGIFAVLVKFAIAAAIKMGFSYVHGRITAPEDTEVDAVIRDAKKAATPTSGATT